jgi:CBS domain-containing protein
MNVGDRVVGEIMQRDVVSLQAGAGLDAAEAVMEKGSIRHIVVLDDRRVVGILSERDVLAASLSKALEFSGAERRTFLRSVNVDEVMSKDVATVGTDTRLRDAAKLLLGRRIGCLPVLGHEDQLVGVVSESDLLRSAFLEEDEEVLTRGAPVEELEPLAAWVRDSLNDVHRMRDEIQVQLHLGKAEVMERWHELEHRFAGVEHELKRLGGHPIEEAEAGVRSMLESLHDSYRRFWEER